MVFSLCSRKYVPTQVATAIGSGGVTPSLFVSLLEIQGVTMSKCQERQTPMKQAHAMKPHRRHFIPNPYYLPALYAMKLHREAGFHLADAISVAYSSFTDKSKSDRISKSELDVEILRKHILSFYASD